MKKLALIVFVLIVTAVAGFGEKKSHEFQTGKLIDVSTDSRLYEGTTHTRAIYTVQLGDLIYTVRGIRVHPRSGGIAKGMIIGDPVQVAQDGDHLWLLLPDGKELKTAIIKTARAQ
jgi:hypothetical protein